LLYAGLGCPATAARSLTVLSHGDDVVIRAG
jgi:hypothetical protein